MPRRQFKYTRASDVRDDRLKSLILMINDSSGSEIASAFCLDEDWQITITTEEGIARFSWEEFLEIFYQISSFVAQENAAMLRENKERSEDNK